MKLPDDVIVAILMIKNHGVFIYDEECDEDNYPIYLTLSGMNNPSRLEISTSDWLNIIPFVTIYENNKGHIFVVINQLGLDLIEIITEAEVENV